MNAATQLRHAPQDFVSRVGALLAAHADGTHIGNLRTQLTGVGDGAQRVPVTVNTSEPGNTWVCSPHTTYVRYAAEELGRFGHPLLTKPLQGLCSLLGGWLWRAGIDDAVAVNNWLLSTNVYPEFDGGALQRWIEEARDRWPRHAIWFRSLNARYTSEWLAALQDLECELIPSRQVYLFDRVDRQARKPRDLARDFALLEARRADLSLAREWNAADFQRAAHLYGLLYLDKYSQLNPHYSAHFLRAWQDCGLLELRGYRSDGGELEAIIGTFSQNGTITAPIVGYDTAVPQERGLYRLLMADVLDQASVTGSRLNLSAGAAGFKRARGGTAELEYSAVICSHLPKRQRRPVQFLGSLTRRIGAPIMRRFEL